jgi:hypothetical protein
MGSDISLSDLSRERALRLESATLFDFATKARENRGEVSQALHFLWNGANQ